MKIQDFDKYDASKQLERWNQVRDNLKIEDKENLVLTFLEKDIWGYLDLLSEILFDIASDSDKYIKILEIISSKVKNDMAQGPFLSMLIRVGKEKGDIAINLRNNIIKNNKDENLIVLSGLILGGIGLKNKKMVLDLINGSVDNENVSSVLQSYLKAILVMNEKEGKIDKINLELIKKLLDKNVEKVNLEILNFSIANYNKDKIFFYKIIKLLISENNNLYKKFLFGRLSYQDIIEEKRLFELIDLSKDANENVLSEIVMCFRKYPSQIRKILDFYFYWISKGLYFQIRNFDWILEEIMKKDSSVLTMFMDQFRRIDKKYSYVIAPHIFESLAKYNLDLALSESIKIKPKDRMEALIKLKLFRVIVGICYTDKTNLKYIQRLAKYIVAEAKNKPYIDINMNSDLTNATTLTKDKYDLLINHISKIIEDLGVKKKAFNYTLIKKNIKKYSYVKKYGDEVIKKCINEKRYSPLLWLLENEVPDLTKIKIENWESELDKATKTFFLRGKFWPRAYLNELNQGLLLFEQIKNDKYKTSQQKKKYIQDILMTEEQFWRFFSEIIFMNKLGKRFIKSKDVIIGSNDIDFETDLFNKLVLFEITSPEFDRSLRLANGAVGLKNKSFSVIDGKYKQIMKTGINTNSKYGNKFYFYIVIDISNSTIDEYDLLNSLFGSLTFNFVIDKSTGKTIQEYTARSSDSIGHKNKKTEIIGGVLYFKRELTIDDKNNPRINLIGNIVPNPNSKKVLLDAEIQEIKKIIFKGELTCQNQ